MALGPWIAVAWVALVCVHSALVKALLFHVEKHHRQTWLELGEPWPWKPTAGNILSSTKFIFFGGALKLWDDRELRKRLIRVWMSVAAALFLVIVAKSIPG